MQGKPPPFAPKSGLKQCKQRKTAMVRKLYANKHAAVPRKERMRATAAAAQMLTGLELQPGKLIVDIFIDFDDCKNFAQLTNKVNPNIAIESGVKIGDVPALVDTGANVIAPVLLSHAFLKRVTRALRTTIHVQPQAVCIRGGWQRKFGHRWKIECLDRFPTQRP